jgi:hypothetical protein
VRQCFATWRTAHDPERIPPVINRILSSPERLARPFIESFAASLLKMSRDGADLAKVQRLTEAFKNVISDIQKRTAHERN